MTMIQIHRLCLDISMDKHIFEYSVENVKIEANIIYTMNAKFWSSFI